VESTNPSCLSLNVSCPGSWIEASIGVRGGDERKGVEAPSSMRGGKGDANRGKSDHIAAAHIPLVRIWGSLSPPCSLKYLRCLTLTIPCGEDSRRPRISYPNGSGAQCLLFEKMSHPSCTSSSVISNLSATATV